MERVFGDEHSGFYSLNARMDERHSCKPYAFFVITEQFQMYRLPEDEHYFFSTSQIEIVDVAKCRINHFYKPSLRDNARWIANGYPGVDGNSQTNADCAGCAESDVLSHHFEHFINMELELALA